MPTPFRWTLRRPVGTLEDRFGKRGAALLVVGALWIALGAATWVLPNSDTYLLLSAGGYLRGALWAGTGAFAMGYALRAPGADAPGFALLYAMPAFQMLAFLWGFARWALPWVPGPGTPGGVAAALGWLGVMVLIRLMANWPEPGGGCHHSEGEDA